MFTPNARSDRRLREFDRALVIATHFGFRPMAAPRITERDLELTKDCRSYQHYDAVEKAAIIRTYLEQNFASLPHPLALAYKKPVRLNSDLEESSIRKWPGGYTLHFIGTLSGIAEATLIRAALSILSEEGYKNMRVDINCIGDKESINAYERELINFARKFGTDMSDESKQSLKEDVFNLFRLETPEAVRLRETVPSAITFLSTPSRVYFKEVLEYIEALGVEFRLTPELVGERNHTSHTIFAIKNTEGEIRDILAIGYRYSRLGRHFGLKKEIPMAGVTVFSTSLGRVPPRVYKELPKPKFYLIQLGREAKIKTLAIIELLRQNHIPLHHFLGKDKIDTQLANAENLRVPYLIIIGQKEALDNTATVRNVATRAQDTVNILDLPRYLKRITL